MSGGDDPVTADDVSPEDIRLYLLGHHWTEAEVVDDYLSVWTREHARRELFVPRTTQASDYATQLDIIARVLAKDEDRSVGQVVADMRHTDSDVIRLRVDTTAFDRGTISFEKAADVIAATHKMLSAAARAAIAPQSYFTAPRPPAEVSDYLASTRLGQTEPGSFVFTLISPVIFSQRFERDAFYLIDTPKSESTPIKLPFARRVTQMLAHSLTSIRGAAHASERSLANVFEDLVEEGVSANLCEALSEIAEQSQDHAVDLDFTWSAKSDVSAIAPRQHIIVPGFITPELRAMAAHLKAVVPEHHYEVIGKVDRLLNQRDSDGFDLYLRANFNNRERLVAIPLANEQRQIASHAWESGQSVFIKGTLDRRFRPYRLLDPSAFQLLKLQNP
jgi:hypothetical protein